MRHRHYYKKYIFSCLRDIFGTLEQILEYILVSKTHQFFFVRAKFFSCFKLQIRKKAPKMQKKLALIRAFYEKYSQISATGKIIWQLDTTFVVENWFQFLRVRKH